MIARGAVSDALYDRLATELSVPVHWTVERETPYPYVVLDSSDLLDRDLLTAPRAEAVVSLSVWSSFAGPREVDGILDDIAAALHRRPLTLAAGRVIQMRVTRSSNQRDADGVTRIGSAMVVLSLQGA